MSETKMKYDWDDAQSCYEAGMFYFTMAEGNRDKRTKGLNLLKQAAKLGSPDAAFMVGKLAWEGYIGLKINNSKNEAMKLLFYAASQGSVQARVLLNEICKERYEEKFKASSDDVDGEGPLVDFQGKTIKINRKGLRTPIDAVLEYENGRNILTFRANVSIYSDEEGAPATEFCQAVLEGMREWAGEYKVFGGQQLTVVIDVEEKAKLFDTVDVFILDEGIRSHMRQVAESLDVMLGGRAQAGVASLMNSKRSFMATSKEWTAKGKKTIFIHCPDGNYEDYDKIKSIVKHEFGHALGLGDLYYEKDKGFDGVEKGTYEELDAYHISDKIYHLVMCDSHGAISNNDIEMIVLAFSENAMQNYQPTSWNYEVSEALGKGN